MPVPELDQSSGVLPLGRYLCTEQEIESTFVTADRYASSATRQSVWNDWQTARDFVRSLVTVHAVWVAGSFTTAKVDPGDIDVMFIIRGDDFDRLPDPAKRQVALFAQGSSGANFHNLKVDSYMIHWSSYPEPDFTDQATLDYYTSRGYWDDWWLRTRSGPKGSPAVNEDAVPKRGYLEVKFDAYL
ncbi:DUF6932 family protein [Streptomyces sp. NPDC004262]